jgi:hypothetical protein
MEFNLWGVHRRSVEQMVETLHQEVSKLRQLLDQTEVAQGLNPRKKRRKVPTRGVAIEILAFVKSGITMTVHQESPW